MKRDKPLRVNLDKLRAIQLKLAEKVVEEDSFGSLENICGLDVSYNGENAVACAVTLKLEGLRKVEEAIAFSRAYFPYIPTFLSFRETPIIMKAVRRLREQVDVFMVDANGVLHPYFLGAASHLGVLLDKPTIGVAKRLLCGELLEPRKLESGVTFAPIILKGRVAGAAVSVKGLKPIYVSVGHKVSLETAVKLVVKTSRHRMPEPLRLAHFLSKRHAHSAGQRTLN
ncbi:MAG: endonuclease V [Candidatus Jordarchaeales archaeon]